MPIHEFKCPICGHKEDQLIMHGDSENIFCAECKDMDHTMVKELSSSNFILKGNCWAKDGYTKK